MGLRPLEILNNFQPLEVVDRGSETQPRVVEHLNKFTYQDMGTSSASQKNI